MVGGLPESPGPPSGMAVSGGVFLWFIGQQCAGPRAESTERRAGPGSRAAGDRAPGTFADRAQGHGLTAGLLEGHRGPGDGGQLWLRGSRQSLPSPCSAHRGEWTPRHLCTCSATLPSGKTPLRLRPRAQTSPAAPAAPETQHFLICKITLPAEVTSEFRDICTRRGSHRAPHARIYPRVRFSSTEPAELTVHFKPSNGPPAPSQS